MCLCCSDNYLKSRQSRHLDDEEIPVEPIKRTNKLVSLILDATSRLISGKSLKIKLPTTTKESLARALEEGKPYNIFIFVINKYEEV